VSDQDPFREAPLSLDQWLAGYSPIDADDQESLRIAANSLQRSAVFKRVMSLLEARVISAITRCAPAEKDTLYAFKLQLVGLRAIRSELQKLVDDRDFEQKRSQKE